MRLNLLSRSHRAIASALALALCLASLPGCGQSPQDRAAARANEDEQQLLQKKIQQGLTKPPATKAKRR